MALFGREFDEPDTYLENPPSDQYLQRLLCKDHIIHLVATVDGVLVGGLVAYVLDKFEQERSEVYIYDLAVAENHRRQGIATSLINELRSISKEKGAWVIFVQAEQADPPAIKLYESLGKKQEVLHFEIEV